MKKELKAKSKNLVILDFGDDLNFKIWKIRDNDKLNYFVLF
jgi:hypothetical protein